MNYTIDKAGSEISWTGFLPASGMSGKVSFSEGTIEADDASRDITGGTLSINLNTIEAIDSKLDASNRAKLTSHLKSADFFDVRNNPLAVFTIKEVNAIGERADSCLPEGIIPPTHEVKGELTINGIKQDVTALVNCTLKEKRMIVQAMFTLDRTQWGMDHLTDRSNGNQRVLPDMEIMVKVIANETEQPLRRGTAAL